jgi:hypothetical protein
LFSEIRPKIFLGTYLVAGFSVTSLEALSPAVLEDALEATSLALQTVLSVIGEVFVGYDRVLRLLHCSLSSFLHKESSAY